MVYLWGMLLLKDQLLYPAGNLKIRSDIMQWVQNQKHIKTLHTQWGVVVHTWNLSTWKADAEHVGIQVQSWLYREFEASKS